MSKIYQAPNGKYYDPSAIRRILTTESGGELTAWVADFRGGDLVKAANAAAKLLRPIRAAFDLPPISPDSGEGVTEEECFNFFAHFSEWLNAKK